MENAILSGQRFGKLTALNEAGRDKSGNILWRCVCDCGNEITVRGSHLRVGTPKSCGCMNGKVRDLTGRIFGRLAVISRKENSKWGQARWKCRCTCGNTTIVSSKDLVSWHTRSCGCQSRETKKTHGQTGTREYLSWINMHQRCRNPHHPSYQNYGARGIKVCTRWNDFGKFWKDMGACPEGLSLDRRENEGHYEPGNCRWASRRVQAKNTRRTRYFDFGGRRLILADLAVELGYHPGSLNGKSDERILRIIERHSTLSAEGGAS